MGLSVRQWSKLNRTAGSGYLFFGVRDVFVGEGANNIRQNSKKIMHEF